MWHGIDIQKNTVNLYYTLCCGQCFRWKFLENEDTFVGVLSGKVWFLKVVNESPFYKVLENEATKINAYQIKDILQDYLRLNTDLLALYISWSDNYYFKKLLIFTLEFVNYVKIQLKL